MRKFALLGVALAAFVSVGAFNSPSASAQGVGIGVGPGGVYVGTTNGYRGGYRDRGYRRSYGSVRVDRYRGYRDRGYRGYRGGYRDPGASYMKGY